MRLQSSSVLFSLSYVKTGWDGVSARQYAIAMYISEAAYMFLGKPTG